MSRNHLVYKDTDVKRFNHVTVVKGVSYLKTHTLQEVVNKKEKLNDLLEPLYEWEETTGRSKCAPEDTYNEKHGLVVASRKAELKANRHYLTKVTEARRAAEDLLKLLKDIEDKVDFKAGMISLNLVQANKKGVID